MALTVTPVESGVLGDLQYRIVDVAFDSSYPTGGEALTASDLGFTTTVLSVSDAGGDDCDGLVVKYYYTDAKLKAFWVDTTTDGALLVEVVNATSLAAQTGVRLFCLGR